MRIKHFMESKFANRDQNVCAVLNIDARNGIEMSQFTQTTQPNFSGEFNNHRRDSTLSSREVNANAPLSNTENVSATLFNDRCKEDTLRNSNQEISSGGHTIQPNRRRRNVPSDEDTLCQRFARIEDGDFCSAASDSEPSGNEKDDVLMGACSNSSSSISESSAATTTLISTVTNRRTLGQIRESLEQKVKRLRAEKEAVDEKIRLAQEEEEIRMRERVKVRGKLIMQRKDRLKNLVSELKSQLEEQSQRLQGAYSTILLLQRTIFRSRSFCKIRRIRHKPALAEAPF